MGRDMALQGAPSPGGLPWPAEQDWTKFYSVPCPLTVGPSSSQSPGLLGHPLCGRGLFIR